MSVVLAFPNLQASCRKCGATRWTMRELNLHEGQDGRCYFCFDEVKGDRGVLRLGTEHCGDQPMKPRSPHIVSGETQNPLHGGDHTAMRIDKRGEWE